MSKETGVAGEAILTKAILQDQTPCPVFGMGGHTMPTQDGSVPANPETLTYTDGIRLTWIEAGTQWTVTSNLPQADLLTYVESISISEIEPPATPESSFESLGFDVIFPTYLPAGMQLLEGGALPLGTGANFAYMDDEGRKISIRQFGMDTNTLPQGHSEEVDINGVVGYVYYNEPVETALPNNARMVIQDATIILFDLQPGVRVTMATELSLEEAI